MATGPPVGAALVLEMAGRGDTDHRRCIIANSTAAAGLSLQAWEYQSIVYTVLD